VIAFSSNYCDLSLVEEAARNVDVIGQRGSEYGEIFWVFVGHSLGGAAAQCLCKEFATILLC